MTPEQLLAFRRKIAKKGGRQTRKRGPEYYSRIGKKGLAKRWGTQPALPKHA